MGLLDKFKFSIPLALLGFFVLLGYLEGSIPGLFAGIVLPTLAFFLLPLSLIPFIGAPIWYLANSFLVNNLLNYLPVYDLAYKVNVIGGIVAGLITAFTSILTIATIYLARRTFKKQELLPNLSPDALKKVMKGNDLQSILDNIIDTLMGIWDKIDKRLLGSVIFWFGLGLATHDFWWETSKADVDEKRPTHGAYFGLELAITGMDMINGNLSFKDKIKKQFLFYIGCGSCFLGFMLTGILPKGFPRIISHVLWWSGVALMVYSWYELFKEDLMHWPKAK